MEQNVDFPVPDRGGRNAGLQQERISERIVEQIVDSRVVGGGLQDFRPVQRSSADEPGVVVVAPHSGPRVPASVSSSTPAPQLRLDAWACP